MGVCTKERKGVTAAVLMATPCTNSLGGENVCVLPKRKKQKARPKGVNLKVRWRAKVAMR
jgi:hypothetical protein